MPPKTETSESTAPAELPGPASAGSSSEPAAGPSSAAMAPAGSESSTGPQRKPDAFVLAVRQHRDASDGQASCDVCRKLHVKCDRVHPICGRCVKQGKTCTYSDVLLKQGRPSKKQLREFAAAQVPFETFRGRLKKQRKSAAGSANQNAGPADAQKSKGKGKARAQEKGPSSTSKAKRKAGPKQGDAEEEAAGSGASMPPAASAAPRSRKRKRPPAASRAAGSGDSDSDSDSGASSSASGSGSSNSSRSSRSSMEEDPGNGESSASSDAEALAVVVRRSASAHSAAGRAQARHVQPTSPVTDEGANGHRVTKPRRRAHTLQSPAISRPVSPDRAGSALGAPHYLHPSAHVQPYAQTLGTATPPGVRQQRAYSFSHPQSGVPVTIAPAALDLPPAHAGQPHGIMSPQPPAGPHHAHMPQRSHSIAHFAHPQAPAQAGTSPMQSYMQASPQPPPLPPLQHVQGHPQQQQHPQPQQVSGRSSLRRLYSSRPSSPAPSAPVGGFTPEGAAHAHASPQGMMHHGHELPLLTMGPMPQGESPHAHGNALLPRARASPFLPPAVLPSLHAVRSGARSPTRYTPDMNPASVHLHTAVVGRGAGSSYLDPAPRSLPAAQQEQSPSHEGTASDSGTVGGAEPIGQLLDQLFGSYDWVPDGLRMPLAPIAQYELASATPLADVRAPSSHPSPDLLTFPPTADNSIYESASPRKPDVPGAQPSKTLLRPPPGAAGAAAPLPDAHAWKEEKIWRRTPTDERLLRALRSHYLRPELSSGGARLNTKAKSRAVQSYRFKRLDEMDCTPPVGGSFGEPAAASTKPAAARVLYVDEEGALQVRPHKEGPRSVFDLHEMRWTTIGPGGKRTSPDWERLHQSPEDDISDPCWHLDADQTFKEEDYSLLRQTGCAMIDTPVYRRILETYFQAQHNNWPFLCPTQVFQWYDHLVEYGKTRRTTWSMTQVRYRLSILLFIVTYASYFSDGIEVTIHVRKEPGSEKKHDNRCEGLASIWEFALAATQTAWALSLPLSRNLDGPDLCVDMLVARRTFVQSVFGTRPLAVWANVCKNGFRVSHDVYQILLENGKAHADDPDFIHWRRFYSDHFKSTIYHRCWLDNASAELRPRFREIDGMTLMPGEVKSEGGPTQSDSWAAYVEKEYMAELIEETLDSILFAPFDHTAPEEEQAQERSRREDVADYIVKRIMETLVDARAFVATDAAPSSISSQPDNYSRFASWWSQFSLLSYVNICQELLSSQLRAIGSSLSANPALTSLRERCKQVPPLDPRDKASMLTMRNRLTQHHHAALTRTHTDA